ncbi:MAG: hypothetical protein R2815_08355 [Flavobacteriales bacterium]
MKKPFRIASLPPDIGAEIRKDYPNEHEAVIRTMESFIREHDYLDHERIVRCIIFLAKQESSSIASVLQSVSGDWRDAIFWAEYEGTREGEEPRHVRDFNKPFGKNEIQ